MFGVIGDGAQVLPTLVHRQGGRGHHRAGGHPLDPPLDSRRGGGRTPPGLGSRAGLGRHAHFSSFSARGRTMRSSTSSSDSVFQRRCRAAAGPPRAPWLPCWSWPVLAAWEFQVRARWATQPSLNDTADRWALMRSQVGAEPGQTVIVGSSRIHVRFRPRHLRLPVRHGQAPATGHARHQSRGPPRARCRRGRVRRNPDPRGGPRTLVRTPRHAGGKCQPGDRAATTTGRPPSGSELHLAGFLQRHLAFIEPDDLSLGALLGRIELPVRSGAVPNLPPVLPAYFAGMDDHRQVRMWDRCAFGSERAQRIQQTWIPLFTPPPPPPSSEHRRNSGR